MSSGKLKKYERDKTLKLPEELEVPDIHITRLSEPFSILFKGGPAADIYTGKENIPFEKRAPLYKSILRKEFSNAIKEFSRELNSS